MTARKSLEELLNLIFGAEDLRRFVDQGLGRPDAEAIGKEIQWDRLESSSRASRVVEALELHGAVDDALFDRLLAALPERASEIEDVARQWLPDRVPTGPGPGRSAPRAPCPAPEGGAWDVFLAHAGPDGAAADQLYEILAEGGLSVFLDSRCLRLGERWDDVIPTALTAARMVVVLVSKRTRDAYYAREEIVLAIAVSRRPDSSSRVIPVYLDCLPDDPRDWLYGLQRLHGLAAADAGWPQGVADRISELFEDEPVEPEATVPPEEREHRARSEGCKENDVPPDPVTPPPPYLHYLYVALDLDRSEQWQALLKESRSQHNGIFLVYGERRQNLELFVARLWHYLAEETDQHHRIIAVPARWEMELPRTGAAWEINLRRAFPAGEGTAADLLFEAARHRPVFLILGEHPLSKDGLDDDEEAIAALEEFLEDRLPTLLAGCTGTHPVRALLATDHERSDDSLEERLYTKIRRGARRQGVRYRRLPEVQHVQWSHIQGYLDGLDPPPPSSVYRVLKTEYQRLDHGRISFQELADRLSRRL
ncbi:MAG: toll/interleukin-1 receptor domain-containing protein [Gammaproteobacteria bacterium]|nr:toll/interleukin-1 receptor domain-containing protein [Gammaproteobacteria bacterium]